LLIIVALESAYTCIASLGFVHVLHFGPLFLVFVDEFWY